MSGPGQPLAVILGAGRGLRYQAAGGTPFKQASVRLDGESLLLRCCRNYRDAGLPVLCALHPALAMLQAPLAALGCRSLLVTDADAGMGQSLAAAVRASADAPAWLIGLADMPFVRSDSIARVAAGLAAGARICAPVHGGRRGHPVGFAAGYGAELAALRGDQGARSLLQRHAAAVQLIEVDDPGVLRDVDLPSDLQAD